MSFSPETRKKALCDALALMLERLGDNAVCSERFLLQEEPFNRVPHTTWRELDGFNFVEPCDTIGHRQRRLTGLGWLKALIVTGRVKDGRVADADLNRKLSTLTATMKGAVKGRHEDAYFELHELERASGLPENFIINVIESRIIDYCYKMHGAEWENDLRSVRVPLEFGLPLTLEG